MTPWGTLHTQGEQVVKQNELTLHIGDRLQLQRTPSDRSPRYLVQVIGMMPSQSVIVSTPCTNGRIAIIRQNTQFAVRVLQGSSVFGFLSSVLQSYNAPFPHLHLSFPIELESIIVRNALRAVTNLSGSVRNTKFPNGTGMCQEVHLVDLSNSGARLLSTAPLGREQEILALRFTLKVCGQEERLGVLAEIRGVGKRISDTGSAHFWTGVQFQSLNRFQRIVLHAYVLECFTGTVKAIEVS